MTRLGKIRKLIKLRNKDLSHVQIEFVRHGKRIRCTSNIHTRLNRFEKDCVLIYFYRMISDAAHCLSNSDLREMVNNTNYAKVFGSPWYLEGFE